MEPEPLFYVYQATHVVRKRTTITMSIHNFDIKGLSDAEVIQSRETHGRNRLDYKKENSFLNALKSSAKEPMVVLLFVAATIYFISGNLGDGLFLSVAILLVASISLYQDSRSRNALEKLKIFTQPYCKVIRNGDIRELANEELVVGDSLIVEEGVIISADGVIVHSNDFSVNESLLTGESLAVYKDAESKENNVFSGTTVTSGLAIVTIKAVGNATALGKIGQSLEDIKEEKTPLEIQISNFVKKMAFIGGVVFLLVWGINFLNSGTVLHSLLQALTLAMSILPEEIPVAFTTFMALGAWRLMKMGIVVKQMKTVETLGSATVICSDKTGTITENKMSLVKLYDLAANKIVDPSTNLSFTAKEIVTLAMWASEPIPFDPMEIALHEAYSKLANKDERPHFKMIHEYPLGGKPPMMTHIFQGSTGERIIAAKGAPEAFLNIAPVSDTDKNKITEAISQLGKKGYRLLGVAEGHNSSAHFPKEQQALQFQFKGLVAFYDPPKQNIKKVLQDFDAAGIVVKLITGDNAATTSAIAQQIGFKGYDTSISGDELMQLSDAELQEKVCKTSVFTRMFPEAKLRIINALKANNEIVAMTGDGINDGPALKAAHIGIAMGKKGTEIAKQAASLILVEDDLAKMVDAIAMGRKIYSNLKKAIQYIISIHIPIILTVLMPLTLGWLYPNIFTPAHIILLELIMGPTCSIIYENEPMEKNTMVQKPRPFATTFFNWKELVTSIVQGLVIALGALGVYQYAVYNDLNENVTRTMVFIVLITANLFLTLVNRSFYYSIITTLRYKNTLVPIIIGVTLALTVLLVVVRPLSQFFQFEPLYGSTLLISIATGFVSVVWYEGVKWMKRRHSN
ncbi:cation-translocating P-type ATPase [Arenibacter sp. GZD96]|uniref:cation-translocating P-type ATPase n=1 Tax=Aurantibrevibacter litoralis TaxID=3106030 RepID=UPI002AFEDA9D|nr:cation-translocating P-type ATPase [Arenibacter sp. GZD-96]MEA1785676.1 cation-translocating P-type ATPase [Arenibacter sp. GZD-96]